MANPVNTIDFNCACGKPIRARIDQGGKVRKCPHCGGEIRVPTVALAAPPAVVAQTSARVEVARVPGSAGPAEGSGKSGAGRLLQAPSTFGQLLGWVMGVWGAFAILMLIVSLFSTVLGYVALVLFLGATGATLQQVWKLLRARQAVLERKDVPLLWGFVRLIAWDPIQGVLVLKNKVVSFSDDNLHDGQGGVRFLYPVLGEELALRVPLEVQTLRFSDSNILTQEYLRVSARGTMKWRIVDIRKFYLLVSRELRSTSDTNRAETLPAPVERPVVGGGGGAEAMLTAAIEWMRILAEEQTRMVISRTKSGLLMADRLSHELTGVAGGHSAALPPAGEARVGSEWGGAADGLARAIHATIAERLEDYGIAVDDVSLQEIKLPEEVVEECIAAARAYYTPMRAQREAAVRFAERAAELRADVELLGKETVGTREVVGAAPAFALTDFVSNYLHKRLAAPGGAAGGPGGPNVDLMIGAAVAGQLAGHVAKAEEGAPGK